jgi:type I restriction enzyme S subunit
MTDDRVPRWRQTTLGRLVALQRGHDLPAAARLPGSVPVIGSGGLTGWHAEAKAAGPGVIIGRAANLGSPQYVRSDYWPLNTTLYVTDFKGNDPRFIYYLFQVLDLTGYNSGSVQPMLNRNYVQNVPVPLVPDREQRAIAEVLGALDDKIEANERKRLLCHDLAQASWQGLSRHTVSVVALGDVADVERGLSYRGAHLGQGVPLVNLANFSVDGHFNGAGLKRYSGEARPRHWVRKGDLVLANTDLTQRREVLGQPALVEIDEAEALFSHHVYAVRVRTEAPAADLLWLYAALRDQAFRDRAVTFATGTTVAALPLDAVLTYEVPWPVYSVRASWATTARALFGSAESAARESRTLDRLRDTLLPKLLSGELRVLDAQALVEEAV